jgi:hypothetical protein
MLTQQPKGQLQSEHEWKKQTHTKYKDKAIYNSWVMVVIKKNNNNNQSYQLEVIIIIIQLNSLFVYLLTQQPKATYRIGTDTKNRNNGQHKDNI